MVFVFGIVFVLAVLFGSFVTVRIKRQRKDGKKSIVLVIVAVIFYAIALISWMYLVATFFLLSRMN